MTSEALKRILLNIALMTCGECDGKFWMKLMRYALVSFEGLWRSSISMSLYLYLINILFWKATSEVQNDCNYIHASWLPMLWAPHIIHFLGSTSVDKSVTNSKYEAQL